MEKKNLYDRLLFNYMNIKNIYVDIDNYKMNELINKMNNDLSYMYLMDTFNNQSQFQSQSQDQQSLSTMINNNQKYMRYFKYRNIKYNVDSE